MQTGRLALTAVALGATMLAAGCGLDVDITGGGPTRTGATQQFEVKLTNTSACPLLGGTAMNGDDDTDFAFVPYIPAALVEDEIELEILCGLLEAPPAMQPSTALAEPGQVSLADLRAQTMAVGAQALATAASCSGMGATCAALGTDGVVVGCALPDFAPGQMLTLTCQATVPPGISGDVYTLAFSSGFGNGVCKAGTNQGQACSGDADCGGTVGACGDGICDGGTNGGYGCDESSDCGGGTCIDCDEGLAIGGDCAESSVVAVAQAPLMGPLALAGAALGLAALARRRLRAPR